MIFSGSTMPRLIIFEASDGDSLQVKDIYSRWKDWVVSGLGAAYPPAFTTVGGDPLGGGLFAGDYYFLNTTDNWLIRPREASHNLVIGGNLYPVNAGDDLFAATLGTWRVFTRLQTSSLTQSVDTGGGGGGPSASAIAAAVWTSALPDGSGVTAGHGLARTVPTKVGAIVSAGGNSRLAFATDLTDTVADFWKDTLVVFTSGSLNGQIKRVASYNGATKVLTVAPTPGFTGIPLAGDTFALINR